MTSKHKSEDYKLSAVENIKVEKPKKSRSKKAKKSVEVVALTNS
jgi:hypothetical protein